MAILQSVILLVSALFVVSEASYAVHQKKCNSKDSECLKNYFQEVVWEAAKNGLPEVGIPILDPVEIKDYHVSVPGWVSFDFDGVGQEMKSCFLNKFWMNFEKRYASMEMICDLQMKGHYKLFSNSSLIRNLLDGDTLHGDGNGGLKFEKMKMSFDFRFKVEQRGGDNFLNIDSESSKFNVDILRGASFAADNLYLGDVEASATIMKVMNQHWKLVMDGTALPFMYKIKGLFYDLTQKYFNNVPVKIISMMTCGSTSSRKSGG
uniref:High affinity nuclear juvenile hormone binding protein n=1 Tax=Manduca sexta TaxID=7130 RepID=Q25477_MANSE|nr:high affinity nuclear juvenile hormone binding protein [Manduca sexta]